MLIAAQLLAGLGLLFVGLKQMGSHLQQAMGRGVRRILQSATRSRLTGFLCGTLTGAVTQSSNAVTMIAANLVRGGVFTSRDAIPVVAGASVGTSVLVFIASVNLKVAVLYLVGLVGIAFHLRLDRRSGWREWMGVLLGLALLFLGLDFIKTAPKGLDLAAAAQMVGSLLTPTRGFLLGCLVAMITQSASTPTILAVAVVQAHVLGLGDGMWLVVGANLGSGLATLLSAGDLKGSARQLCLSAIQSKVVGCILVGFAAIAASQAGVNIDELLVRAGGADPAIALSLVFLTLQLAGALPVVLFADLTERLSARLSPETTEERLSRPRFIHEKAVRDPPTALDLVARETGRLVVRMPDLLPDLDQPDLDDRKARLAAWTGADAIAHTTERFLADLIDQGLTREDLDLALRAQAQVELVRALQDTLHELAVVVDAFRAPPPLIFNLSESLRAVLLVLSEAVPGETLELDFDDLAVLTADRSALLDKIRRDLAASCATGGDEVRNLMRATSLFERALWLVRRLSLALRPRTNEANRPDERSDTQALSGPVEDVV
ncbi:phosphate:Na+ symporter [Azorhizobium sp. AG788]|uniref:Na/Pi symporter n=1 Tax=Azorhizobium sp. AG788 TaxID=2183897 RepID=UPI0010616A9E|nr:Na/Pi symporter [Azorhizobium sp. AG788]TDT89390.1 phosphate:Na+ symporter [Azorhizobium sp. AG788]